MPRLKPGVDPASRTQALLQRRQAKMATSAHAYVRGNTEKFYLWLNSRMGRSVPQGPPVWICGDCHVGNIGPLADSYGEVEIQIRDLDQAVIGNPAHDLIRLALSLATAARGSDLPGIIAVKMIEEMIAGYEGALVAPARQAKVSDVDALAPIRAVLDESHRRQWRHLAEERIQDVKPSIPLGERFWALEEPERGAIDKIFADERVAQKINGLKGRKEKDKLRVVDAAYWMKGCSSLGRLRYAVLLSIGRKKDATYCLIDLKEAAMAAAPFITRYKGKNQAERVVAGARALSPNLGERMMAVTLLRRPVVMRELMPQDLKFDLDRLTEEQAIAAARYLAAVVGKAHGRQMDRVTATAWRGELRKRHSKSLDAPSWLWTSVLSLIAEHEVAYLEHCRKYANETARDKRRVAKKSK